ncbi:polysaccharide deacetylase family protein [Longimicrobium sp.]|uniref:polysaccharide deacetylase family protein n=1 Tax=Longimicrobium sp. TaxID=2029185 RepID=UPI002D133441|nr:polysaccharide deacetylase family protein [Longimicrobium sp.]HSU15943.1 polysaccharide deacetylase family protein [Longimicrobium sp.]
MTTLGKQAAAAAALALLLAACGGDRGGAEKGDAGKAGSPATAGGDTSATAANGRQANGGAAAAAPGQDNGPKANTGPNELGRILVLEYHRIGPKEGEWYRSEEHFRNDLKMLYDRGFRPVTMRDVASGNINLPAGTSPVVFVFDDSSQGQFYYQPDGSIDPHTMVGMWEAFKRQNPAWSGGGTWCVLPGAVYPSNFWGEKKSNEIAREQREATIKKKVDFLLQNGHEICNHTMWHAQLSKYPDAFVQEQIGSGQDSIAHYLPADYRITTFALPLGLWPRNRPLAWHGTYRGGKSYDYQVVLEVSGGANVSPFDRSWDPHSVDRFIAAPNALENQLKRWDANPAERYVSDGDPNTVSYPQREASKAGNLRGKQGKVVPDSGPPAGGAPGAAPAGAAPAPAGTKS